MNNQTTRQNNEARTNQSKLPWYFKPGNAIVMSLQKVGIVIGPQRVLTVPGRKSGQLRSTPVTAINIDGYDYIATGFETDWVKNSRAAGWGYIKRGRKQQKVKLVEMELAQRIALLHKYISKLGLFKIFAAIVTVPTKADDIEREAPHVRMFRMVPEGKG